MTHPYIPNAKIKSYLLNRDHPQGQGKARFFAGIGFSLEQSERLESALKEHTASAGLVSTSESYGGESKLVFQCEIKTPSGKKPCIRSVWIQELQTDRLRFVTAYPFE